MEVDFNNVRKQAVYALEDLTEKLNNAIIKRDDQYAVPNNSYNDNTKNLKGYVVIDADSLQRCMDQLRRTIGAIAMTYEPGDEKFKDVYGEIYADENSNMPLFNCEEEEC